MVFELFVFAASTAAPLQIERYTEEYNKDIKVKVGSSHVGLLGELDFSCSLPLGHHVLILDTHNTTTPGSSERSVVVELGGEGGSE
jgi:hypothetical protein